MKKPTVKLERKTYEHYLDNDLEMDNSEVSEFIEILREFEDIANQDPDKCSEIILDRVRYGWESEEELRVYYIAYSETEEEHKERVAKEVEALEDWQEWKKERYEAAKIRAEELRVKRIKDMEEELTKLKEGL